MERSQAEKRLLFGAALLMLSTANFAQTGSETGSGTLIQGNTEGGTLSYIGDYTRLSIGYDSELDLYGEYFQVFGENTRSAWIGQGWLADDAGGLQLNYHWMSGSEEDSESAHINKVFVAVDQNQYDDRKLTFGYGFENRDYFLGAYASKSLTDERFVGQRLTPDSTISIFEHPYDYGVGFRGGRFFEESLLRLRGGVDYEWGEEDSSQITLSFSGEKFFYNSPHSLGLHTEFLNKSGDFEDDEDDARIRLLYRYSFGESYRPTSPVQAAPVAERRVIRNDISLATDAFFDLDKSRLRADAAQALDSLIQQLQAAEVVSNIQIIGHTCDLGSTPYNQRLSERRANTVRDYFIAKGFSPAALEAEGRGELEPKFPNDGEPNRRKNRRVDIAVMTVEEIEQPVGGPIQVQSTPAWIQRGLRNPVEHKRSVDYYRIEQAQANDDGDNEEDMNNPPVAVDDAVTISGAVVIDVLANDSDPDGDAITIVSVTQPANGTVVNNGDSVTYTPNPGFSGTDTFTYTIQDPDGSTSTATVTVTVEDNTPPPVDPNNPPDAVDDSAVTNRNTPVTIDVLANDSDPDGDELTITAVTQGENGSVVNNGSDVTYTPNQSFRGTDRFTYTISDGNGGTDTATVTVVIPRY